jgi:sugar phosphate permease
VIKPTRYRWVVLALFCSLYLISYIDRGLMSVVAPEISEEFELDSVQMGWLFAVFTWAYAFAQIPVGFLGDRIGPKKVLVVIISIVSVSVAMTGAAVNYLMLLLSRIFLGLSESGAFPVASRAMQLWFHRSERGRIQGITHFFSRAAVALTPIAAVPIVYLFGWRSVFFIAAAIGMVWVVIFVLAYKNHPKDHPRVNDQELALIYDSIENIDSNPKNDPIPWGFIFRSRNMWAICAGYGCFFFGTNFYLTWYPTYLREYRGLSLLEMGLIGALPLIAGMAGDIIGGSITDLVLKKTKNPTFSRRIVAAPGFALAALFIIPAAMTDSVFISVGCLALSFFFLEFVIGPAWAVPMDVGGVYSGTVTGIMNMAGALTASLTPLIYGYLFSRGYWIEPFFVSSGVLFLGAIIWSFFIHPDVSVINEQESV